MRYRTNWYVTENEAEARRLAAIDKTPWEMVKIADAKPVHIQVGLPGWILWSDGALTTNIGIDLPAEIPMCIPKAVARLISDARGSDSGLPEGGWGTLTRITEVVREETVAVGSPRGYYAPMTVTKYTVKYGDEPGELWVSSAGYSEGYAFDVFKSRQSLQKAMNS